MLTSTTESIASAINYGASLKQPVAFACMVGSTADKMRRQIIAGEIEGISFPAPKVEKPYASPFTEAERRAKVSAINDLRRKGVKARLAAKEGGDISYQTYSRWMDDLDMRYSGPTLSGRWRTIK